MTGKQCLKIARLIGKVDVIITDSPIAIGAMYTDEQPYKDVCIYEAFSAFTEDELGTSYEIVDDDTL